MIHTVLYSLLFFVIFQVKKLDSAGFILNNNASLGYRQPNTIYTAGKIAYHASLPTGWYLECTTAGTSGNEDLTISSPTVNSTVSDGTTVWTIRNIVESLYTIYGNNFDTAISDMDTAIKSGVYSYGNGTANIPTSNIYGTLVTYQWNNRAYQIAMVDLFESNSTQEFNTGKMFTRIGYTLNSNPTWLNWQQQEAIVAKSLGITSGYIMYASGLILQWGYLYLNQGGYKELNFPISFKSNNNYIGIATLGGNDPNCYISVNLIDKTKMLIKTNQSSTVYANWLVIGY